jgi:hypothetical protein
VVVDEVEVDVVAAVDGATDGRLEAGIGASGEGLVVVAEAKLETSESAKASRIMRRFILRAPQVVG